jgi:hypothetical protein
MDVCIMLDAQYKGSSMEHRYVKRKGLKATKMDQRNKEGRAQKIPPGACMSASKEGFVLSNVAASPTG